MSDEGYEYEGLTLCVKYEPDTLTTAEAARPNPREQGAGFLVIGVELDGVFVPIERRKAAGLRADLARAKAESKSKSDKPKE